MASHLQLLLRLRHIALDDARQGLASRLQDAALAAAAERAAALSLWREREAASSMQATDTAVEAFAAWLPTGLKALDAAREASERAEAACAQARAKLAAARGAAEAIASMLDAEAAKARLEASRREQAILDEAALSKRPCPPL
ncbi:hypothetical protein [Limobrevibacterium gyesilva]|uniref:Flagellar FliJ protein n=1 Tax=Limobrevibacterium gyesilva TaxID=2991712 RepID=A0AA41YIV8_9PROT|nr:hypothetical protein [Limobrevibacterium gyesilva]MCW3473310.1 hypothetical protein [Limobrevibacterium gyesilva]